MDVPTITINLDDKCPECGKGGATQNGICMGCTTRAIQGKPMKTPIGRNVSAHIKRTLASFKSKR